MDGCMDGQHASTCSSSAGCIALAGGPEDAAGQSGKGVPRHATRRSSLVYVRTLCTASARCLAQTAPPLKPRPRHKQPPPPPPLPPGLPDPQPARPPQPPQLHLLSLLPNPLACLPPPPAAEAYWWWSAHRAAAAADLPAAAAAASAAAAAPLLPLRMDCWARQPCQNCSPQQRLQVPLPLLLHLLLQKLQGSPPRLHHLG